MKILQVVDGIGWGGTKEQVYLTTRELAKKSVNIGIAISYQYRQMEEKLKPYDVKIHKFEDHRGSKSRFNPANWWRLKRIIEENDYNIVVANSPHATDYVRFTLPFLRKKPKLVTVKRSGRVPSRFSKWFKYSVFDRIVVVSEEVRKTLERANFFPERLRVIKSGIDLSRFYPYREQKEELRRKLGFPCKGKIFINVANWNPKVKGHILLLEAFKKLDCKDCYLVLVGLETDGREAKSLISKLGLENKVITLGFREDIPDLLNTSDYFVLASYLEGIAGALLQAMATEMVVISTDAGGIKEYLKDGYNGFLTPVGDRDRLVRAMEIALKLTAKDYRKFSTNARKTAENYSIERTAEGYINLFEELLSES